MAEPSVAVVIVAFNNGDDIVPVLEAVQAQQRPGDEIIVVDNASADDTVAVIADAAPGVRLVPLGTNTGFAGGVNHGAALAGADLLLLLNPDAIPAPGCLDALRRTAVEEPRWGCWQAVVALPGGSDANTVGGRVHLLGFGWSGNWGEPLDPAMERHEVGFASGAALCIRTTLWHELGGFDPHFFMYAEDLELSVRVRSAGWGVGVEPAAVVEHEYEFDKGHRKWFYLERNRWAVLLATYPRRLLLLTLAPLLVLEVLMAVMAARQGWWPVKRRASVAVLRDLRHNLRRRRAVQAQRTISDRAFAQALTVELDGAFFGGLARSRPISVAQRGYAALVLRLLSDSPPRRSSPPTR